MRHIDATQFFWLVTLSVLSSATALLVDEAVFFIVTNKMKYRDNYWFWIIFGVIAVVLAQACIQFISKKAAGSGIPQMRAIMTGVKLPGMLSKRTCIGKVMGMICMLSSGMSLGKEGPFVHIAGCIADSMPY
jgi:chloride channel 2